MRIRPRMERDERGSLIVAVMVMMVLVALSSVVVARTVSAQKSGRQAQDFSGALAQGDAGLSDALFRIDQLGTNPATTFCVGNNAACTLSSVPAAPGVQYTARRVDDNTYTVLSKGLVNGQPHAIQATVTRGVLYPYVLFAKNSITFNGNTSDYDPVTGQGPIETMDPANNVLLDPAPTIEVPSGGTIDCQGRSPSKRQVYYGSASVNCANPQAVTTNYNPLDPVLTCPTPANLPPQPCRGASFTACPAVNGTLPAILAPGVYWCSQTDLAGSSNQLSFPSTFTVGAGAANGGVVSIYVIPTNSTNLSLSISGATVNSGGDPTRLRVYLAGSGGVDPGNGSHGGNFTGIMYAPSAAVISDGCKAQWRGAIVVGSFTCNGGPHAGIIYDTRIAALTSAGWTVSNFSEIPSTRVTLP
jgi:Tfp pilus assembly protein PilX